MWVRIERATKDPKKVQAYDVAEAMALSASRLLNRLVPRSCGIEFPDVKLTETIGNDSSTKAFYPLGSDMVIARYDSLDSIPHEVFHYYEYSMSMGGKAMVPHDDDVFSSMFIEAGAYFFNAAFLSKGSEPGTLDKLWHSHSNGMQLGIERIWHYILGDSLESFAKWWDMKDEEAKRDNERFYNHIGSYGNLLGGLLAPLVYASCSYDAKSTINMLLSSPGKILKSVKSAEESRIYDLFARLKRIDDAPELSGNAVAGINWIIRK